MVCKTEKKPFVRLEKKETLEEQLKKILAEKTIESRERAYTVAIGSYRGNFKTLDEVSDFLNQVRKKRMKTMPILLYIRRWRDRSVEY